MKEKRKDRDLGSKALAEQIAVRTNRWVIEAIARLVGAPRPHLATDRIDMLLRLRYSADDKSEVETPAPRAMTVDNKSESLLDNMLKGGEESGRDKSSTTSADTANTAESNERKSGVGEAKADAHGGDSEGDV